MDIVLLLLKGENHIRALAKDLGTNQMTVSRKMKDLKAANVADYRQEGKNKVFFLKKTAEARQYVYMAEHQKLLDTLKRATLRLVIEKIQKNRKLGLAVLFGSYAKGTAHKDSDIDIYIETTSSGLKRWAEDLDSRLSVKIGRFNTKTPLAREMIKDHVIIKGVERFHEQAGILD
jgi:predicted nucleotidyltransferase